MVSALTTSRIQVLTRMKNKAQLREMLLTEERNTLRNVYSEAQREAYNSYYALAITNGTLTDDEKSGYTQMVKNLENLMYQANMKENDIDLQIKGLDTQIALYEKEIESLQKLNNQQIKDDAPKLTM